MITGAILVKDEANWNEIKSVRVPKSLHLFGSVDSNCEQCKCQQCQCVCVKCRQECRV